MRNSSARALPTLSALSTRQGDSVTASSRQCVLFVRSCCVDRFFTGPTIIPDMPSSPSRSGRIRNIPILAVAQYNTFFLFFKSHSRKKMNFFTHTLEKVPKKGSSTVCDGNEQKNGKKPKTGLKKTDIAPIVYRPRKTIGGKQCRSIYTIHRRYADFNRKP